jgi:hypothetical protein
MFLGFFSSVRGRIACAGTCVARDALCVMPVRAGCADMSGCSRAQREQDWADVDTRWRWRRNTDTTAHKKRSPWAPCL